MKNLLSSLVLAVAATLAFPCVAATPLLKSYEGPVAKRAQSVSGGTAVTFNREGLETLRPGDEVELALPSGRRHAIVFDLLKDHGDGTVSFVGFVKDTLDRQRVIITTGAGGSFGSIVTPEGAFSLVPGNGHDWLVDMVAEQEHLAPINLGHDSMPIPATAKSKAATPSTAAGTTMQLVPGLNSVAVANAMPTPQNVVDIMFVYTPEYAAHLGAGLDARLNQLVTSANVAYADSEVAITLRRVHATQIAYSNTSDAFDALCAITPVNLTVFGGCTVVGPDPAFASIESLRTTHGADVVAFLRDGADFGGSGLAWVPRGAVDSSDAPYMYSVVTGCVSGCDFVFIHELGHNMGNNHDRATTAWENGGLANAELTVANVGGAYSYSFGYSNCSNGMLACNPFITNGTAGSCVTQPECQAAGGNNFSDIMAYFHGSTLRNLKFSNYQVTCRGTSNTALACGAYEGNGNAANTALSMNNSRAALSAMRASAGPLPSSTTVVPSQNPAVFGTTVTFTATVSAGSGTLTGTVNFRDNGVSISGCAAQALNAAGVAMCSTSSLAVGTHPITAVYSGSANHDPSTSAVLSEGIYIPVLATPTVTVTPSQSPAAFGAAITLSASVGGSAGTPTGTVAFRANGTTIAGCGAIALVGGAASCLTSTLPVGVHSITAVYSGNATYNAGTSPALSLGIYIPPMLAPSVAVASSQNPSVFGTSITFTATVSGASGVPTGTVTFRDGGVPFCGPVAMSAGRATCTTSTLSIGSHAITAAYSGNATYNAATSPNYNQGIYVTSTVTPTVTIATSLNPALVGVAVTFTAQVSGSAGIPTGAIAFRDGGVAIPGCGAVALNAQARATCTTSALPVGSRPVTAAYSGSGTYTAGTSSTLSQGIYLITPTITVSPSQNPQALGLNVTLTATVTGAGGVATGTVNFRDNGVSIPGCGAVALNGAGAATCSTSSLTQGVHPITVAHSGGGPYMASTSATLNLGIYVPTPVNPTVSVSPSQNPAIFGQSVTFTATVSGSAGVPTGIVTFRDNGVVICGPMSLGSTGQALCTTNALSVGSHPITVAYAGSSVYNAATSPTLNEGIYVPALPAPTITLAPSNNPQLVGLNVTFTATVAGGLGMPTGTVNFRDNGVSISGCAAVPLNGSGVATCSTSALALGSHPITAVYSGNATYASVTSATLSEGIYTNVPTTALYTSQNPAVAGSNVTFTIIVSGAHGVPVGTVTLRDGAFVVLCGSVTLVSQGGAGVATCSTTTLAVGVHNLTAQFFPGNGTYSPGVSNQLDQGIY